MCGRRFPCVCVAEYLCVVDAFLRECSTLFVHTHHLNCRPHTNIRPHKHTNRRPHTRNKKMGEMALLLKNKNRNNHSSTTHAPERRGLDHTGSPLTPTNNQTKKKNCGVHMELEIYAPHGRNFVNIGRSQRSCPLRRNLGPALTYVAERAPTTCTPCRAKSLRHPETKCDKKGDELTFPHVTIWVKKNFGPKNIFGEIQMPTLADPAIPKTARWPKGAFIKIIH